MIKEVASLKSFLMLLILLTIFSCQDNELNIRPNQEIENAKMWFEKNKSLLIRNSSSGRLSSNFQKNPDWNKTKVHQFKNGLRAVEVILNYETYLLFSEDDGANTVKPNVINSMLLVERRPGEYGVYLLKIYPEEYDNRLDSKDFRLFNFATIPDYFSGSMMVFDWDENFIGGWKISNGKKTHFYGKAKMQRDPNGRITGTSSLNCYAIDTYWYSQACIRGVGCSDPVLIEITTTIVCELVIAPPSEDPGEGGGGGPNPDENNCFEEHPYIEGLMVPCEELETITNNVTDPCISSQVNKAIAESMTNEISNLIRDIFGVNDIVNLTIDQIDYLDDDDDAIADGYWTPTGSVNIEISFNGNTMPSASQEYIMATLYHEFLHAIMHYNGIEEGQQHEPMATGYINILASALIEHFPGLSLTDAVNLAWGGLHETDAWANLRESEKAEIISTNIAHKNSQSGTPCN